jgi:hypothetical protein
MELQNKGCRHSDVKTKELPKEAFSVKLKKGEKISRQRDNLLAIKWKDVRDVHFLTTAHEDIQASLVIRDLTLRIFAITRFRGKKT